MQRRQFIKSAMACSTALAVNGTVGIGSVHATGTVGDPSSDIRAALVGALREIGGQANLATAARLEDGGTSGGDFSFHVRHGGIDNAGASRIATALKSAPPATASTLVSFSLSYNGDIGDVGAIALAEALPPTVRDLGLVGCNIGDAGGLALHAWAQTAHGLRMICIENNWISADLRSRFQGLPGIAAYV